MACWSDDGAILVAGRLPLAVSAGALFSTRRGPGPGGARGILRGKKEKK